MIRQADPHMSHTSPCMYLQFSPKRHVPFKANGHSSSLVPPLQGVADSSLFELFWQGVQQVSSTSVGSRPEVAAAEYVGGTVGRELIIIIISTVQGTDMALYKEHSASQSTTELNTIN